MAQGATENQAGIPMPWWGLLALSAAAFIDVMTDLLPTGVLVPMSRGLGVAPGSIGFLVSAYAVASAGAAIPLTAALRGWPRRRLLGAVLGGFALCNAITALSSAYPLTLASRIVAGALGGLLWAMLAGYAARMVPPERRGRAVAVVLAGITAALAVGVPAGTTLASAVGWRTTFAALAVVAAGLVIWVAAAVPPVPGDPPSGRVALRDVATQPGVAGVLTVTALVLGGHQAMYTYLAPFAHRAGFADAGPVLFGFGAATVVGIVLVAVVADARLRAALLAALSVMTAVLVAFGVFGTNDVVLLIGAVCWGVAFGAAPTLVQIALINASGLAHADVATSMQTTVYNIGIAAGSFAGGVVIDTAGSSALPWIALPLVAAGLATVVGARRTFPPSPLTAP